MKQFLLFTLLLIFTASAFEFTGKVVRELVVETTVYSVSRYVKSPGILGSHRD